VKTFPVRGIPTDLAVGGGAVWVGTGAATPSGSIGATYTAGVSRLDLDSGLVTRTVDLSGPLITLPTTTYEPVRLPGVNQLAAGAGAVWAINPDRTVSRIDPTTGRVVARVRVFATHAIAAAHEGVWVIGRGPTVTRIDPRSNRAGQTIRLEATGLAGLALGGGSVWATDPADGLVWRIEPGRDPVSRSIDVGVGATSIAFADGAAWTTDFIGGRLLRIDPRTNTVTSRTALASTPAGVAAGNGSVWVSVGGGGRSATLPSSTCGAVVAGGGARPDVLIASDLPLKGPQSAVTHAMVDAIGFELRRHGFRAGKFAVGYQSCDDSTAQMGSDDLFTCAANAKAFAETTSVVAVIGPYNSSCAEAEIPITNRTAGGPLAMISPSNTREGLTRRGPGVERGAPGSHYPTGMRSYVRVAAPDDVFAAGAAVLAKQLGLRAVFLLTTGQTTYGVQLAGGFSGAARKLGVGLAGSGTWDPSARSYAPLAERVARSHADGVFLADFGLNEGALIRALRARLGPRTALIASDGFLPVSAMLKDAGAAAVGVYVIFPVAAAEMLGPAGRRFVRAFGATQPGGVVQSGTYVPEAAAATDVVLQAIARSDGTRASVLRQLRNAKAGDGILGPFRFDLNGDMDPALVTAFRVTGKAERGVALVSDFRGSRPVRLMRVPTRLLDP
jgi:branched-chain amino acid transport system substrate-binding protein